MSEEIIAEHTIWEAGYYSNILDELFPDVRPFHYPTATAKALDAEFKYHWREDSADGRCPSKAAALRSLVAMMEADKRKLEECIAAAEAKIEELEEQPGNESHDEGSEQAPLRGPTAWSETTSLIGSER
jgi:hypothetical protein